MAPAVGAMDDGGIIAEVQAKHGNSTQPESKQVVAVLQAIIEVIKAENWQVTPTSLFAAVMTAMDRPDTLNSQQVTLAMCTLLSHILVRIPNGVLRSKFVGCVQVLNTVIEKHRQQAPVARAVVACLSSVLAALDPANWPAAHAPFNTLLTFCVDARPKVRRRAQQGLQETMAALQHTAALQPASEALLKVCQAVLPGPEAAARAAAAASNKQRAAAEEAITRAVSDALHLLGALKSVLPLMSAGAAKGVVDLLFKLYPLKQPLLSRHTTEALQQLAGSGASHLPAATLAEMLQVVMDAEDVLWGARADTDLVLALTRLLEQGLTRLARLDAGLAAPKLAKACHLLVPQLCAEQDGVRYGTAEALKALLRACLTPDMVAEAAARAAAPGGAGAAPAASVVAAVTSALGPRYQEAWGLALPVVSELIERLAEAPAPAGASLSRGLLEVLGQLLQGAADASEAGLSGAGQDATMAPVAAADYAAAADAALGTALRCLGPDTVLQVLPLNLKQAIDALANKVQPPPGSEPRTWLLPALRRHVRGCQLATWGQALFPLARVVGSRAVAARKMGHSGLAQSCQVLELQLWHCLPAFASWARDLPAAYPAIVKEVAGAFSNREDLRPAICNALQRMCCQVRSVLKASGAPSDQVGFSDPMGAAGLQVDEDEDYGAPKRRPRSLPGAHDDSEAGHSSAPEWYTLEVAQAAASALRQWSKSWLPLLCKTFLETEPEARNHIAAAISCYSSISDASVVAGVFRVAVGKLAKLLEDAGKEVPPPDAVLEGGQDVVSRRCSFTELALCLAPGLDDVALATLFKAVKGGLVEPEAAIQKKSYKVLAHIATQRPAFLRAHLQELLSLVVAGSAASLSASKRYRLRCLQPLVLLLSSPSCPDLDWAALLAAGGEDEDMSDADDESDEEGGSKRKGKKGGKAGKAKGAEAEGRDADRKRQLVGLLLGEIVLAVKEANIKTRTSAYELVLGLGHSMSDMDMDGDDDMGGGAATSDGLHHLFNMVLAGLVGSSPHMISASVMALARLLYEFAPRLEAFVPQLLPAVLMLLRTKAREVVKSVLGFVKVCTMRMPADVLSEQVAAILEGILLWAEDSKNKFKLKVRVIVERLARRVGFDAVAEAMPPAHAKLLTHIRKERSRRDKKRAASQAGSEAGDEDEGDARSMRSRALTSKTAGAKTARASQWGHSDIFSDEEGGDDEEMMGGRGGPKSVRSLKSGRQAGRNGGAGGPSGRLQESSADPLNLLDASTSRNLVKSAAGMRQRRTDVGDDDFQRNDEGRLVIQDDEKDAWKAKQRGKKRGRGGEAEWDSDDSDFEDIKGYHGAKEAFKREGARSIKSLGFKSVGGASMGGKSFGGKSFGGKSFGAGSNAPSQGGRSQGGKSAAGGKSVHSGDRFKSKAAGGDVKGKAKVEPYAYWSFDRKMLNRRRGKQASANKSLTSVVNAAQVGAAKGGKAKRLAAKKRRL